jgi:hypothetical protein
MGKLTLDVEVVAEEVQHTIEAQLMPVLAEVARLQARIAALERDRALAEDEALKAQAAAGEGTLQ